MKNTKVDLVPLCPYDREQFILDNQWAFKHGALIEFGERDDHIDDDGEIISRKTIERSIDEPDSEAYRIVFEGRNVGGIVLKIDKQTNHNHLDLLFVSPQEHGKGIGYGAWQAAEAVGVFGAVRAGFAAFGFAPFSMSSGWPFLMRVQRAT